MVLDKGSFTEWAADLVSKDPLQFPGYLEKIAKTQGATGLSEAVIVGRGRIRRLDTAIGVMSRIF